MKIDEEYENINDPSQTCVIVKLVEHLVHEYFVHVKIGKLYLIYTKQEFFERWRKK